MLHRILSALLCIQICGLGSSLTVHRRVDNIFKADNVNKGKKKENRRTIKKQEDISGTLIDLPSIDMRISLSNFLPDIHTKSLREGLEDLTISHLTDSFYSYINEKESSSSFNYFFIDVSIGSGDSLHDQNSIRRQRQNRFLNAYAVDKSHVRETNELSVSIVNAEINGYAVFDRDITNQERHIIEDLPTLAFIGAKHKKFLEEMQASHNEALSSVVQISISSSIGANTNAASEELVRETIKLNYVLIFVCGCFLVGVIVGGLVVYKFSHVIERQDDDTAVTSDGSFSASNTALTRKHILLSEPLSSTLVGKLFSRDNRPTESISIEMSENEIIGESTSLDSNNDSKRTSNARKPRLKKKRSPKHHDRRNIQDLNSLTAIEEESDNDLFIDFVDDMVMGHIRKKGSLFPTLQDRLSNVKIKNQLDLSHDDISFNDTYTPTKYVVQNENRLNHYEYPVDDIIQRSSCDERNDIIEQNGSNSNT